MALHYIYYKRKKAKEYQRLRRGVQKYDRAVKAALLLMKNGFDVKVMSKGKEAFSTT